MADWGALLDAAKNNPEIKALIGKLSGSAEEVAPKVERDVTNSVPKLNAATSEAPPVEAASTPPPDLPTDQSTMVEDLPPPEEQPIASSMSTKQKAAIAGGVGAAGLGAAKLLQKDETNDQINDSDDSNTTSNDNVPEVAEPSLSREPAAASSEEEAPAEPSGDKEATKAAPVVDAKEEQFRKAISNILNFGQQGPSGPNALEKAIQDRNERLRANDIQEGFARLGAGIARVKPDVDLYEKRRQEANLPLTDLDLKNKYEASDPKSGLSQGMRDYAKSLGLNVSDGTSAAQLQQVLPMVWKDIEAKQAQAARSADLANRLQVAQMNKQAQLAQAQAYRDVARQDKLNKQGQDQYNKGIQQAESVRGNRAIQSDMETVRRVQNAKSILKLFPNPNDVPANMLSTFDADMASIMMGGVPGEGVMHEVSNPTIMKKMAQTWQSLKNAPVGARASAFLSQYGKYFDTLGNDAQSRIYDRYKRIGNTMGSNWSPDQKESFRSEYLPGYIVNHKGQFAKPEHMTDDEIKQQWLKLQQQKAQSGGQ